MHTLKKQFLIIYCIYLSSIDSMRLRPIIMIYIIAAALFKCMANHLYEKGHNDFNCKRFLPIMKKCNVSNSMASILINSDTQDR